MTRLNHERVGRLERSRRSQFPASFSSQTEWTNLRWSKLNFGRHPDLSVPELILTHPRYFYWAFAEGAFQRNQLRQVDFVHRRAAHILPPAGRRDCEFGFEIDGTGELARVRLLQKCKRLKRPHGCEIVRTPHLCLEVVNQFRVPTQAADVLVRWFRSEYFDEPDAEWSTFCETFFENDDNFDLRCRQRHTRLN